VFFVIDCECAVALEKYLRTAPEATSAMSQANAMRMTGAFPFRENDYLIGYFDGTDRYVGLLQYQYVALSEHLLHATIIRPADVMEKDAFGDILCRTFDPQTASSVRNVDLTILASRMNWKQQLVFTLESSAFPHRKVETLPIGLCNSYDAILVRITALYPMIARPLW
jgi:hypothetical protein